MIVTLSPWYFMPGKLTLPLDFLISLLKLGAHYYLATFEPSYNFAVLDITIFDTNTDYT